MYMANHYVRVNGTVYVKGECITEDLPAEKEAWLLRAGAIRVMEDHRQELPAQEPAPEPEDIPEPEEEAEDVEEACADPEAEEADEDVEAPEIDVMAGIVTPEPQHEQKQKPVRKAAERRKA